LLKEATTISISFYFVAKPSSGTREAARGKKKDVQWTMLK